jgi:hypothetical protein
LVGDPRYGEEGDQVSSPVIEEEFESGNYQQNERNPVAEAVLAGPDVEELSLDDAAAGFALFLADITPLAKDLFLRDGPCDAGGCDRQNYQPIDLMPYAH